MKKRREKSFHIRLNMDKETDREIYEWLRAKEERQTISINAFVIEGLRKLKIAEMRSDAGTFELPVIDSIAFSKRQVPQDEERTTEKSVETGRKTDFENQDEDEAITELSAEAMDFLDGF